MEAGSSAEAVRRRVELAGEGGRGGEVVLDVLGGW